LWNKSQRPPKANRSSGARGSHEASFKDRLLKSAEDAREQAARLPAGPMRERLLLKAKQSETAAGIETWISSPGSQAPDNLDLLKKPRD
jgi:hypothetical protein